MQSAYEDKVKGIIPEDICVGFIEKYSAEQKTLKEDIATLEEKISQAESATQNVDEFISNIKYSDLFIDNNIILSSNNQKFLPLLRYKSKKKKL